MAKKLILIMAVVFTTGSLSGANPHLKSFSARSAGSGVLLEWTIIGGSICNGTLVYRSTDSVSWEQAGHIGGVCGSSEDDVLFTWVDEDPPENQRLFYRLDLFELGFSGIIYVDHYVVENEPYKVLDAVDDYTILFKNPFRYKVSFSLYSLTGKLEHSIETNSDRIVINKGEFRGIYLFSILSNQHSINISGKLALN
jgi:hypothetical protein